jgi:ribosomal protein S6
VVVRSSPSTGGVVAGWPTRSHETEGYYLVVRFTAEPSAQERLERTLHLADEIVRFKVLVLPEKREQRKRQAAGGGARREATSPATA